MKKNCFIIVLAVFLAGAAFPLVAQTKIPADVQAVVDELYPNAEGVDWENVEDEKIIYLEDNDNKVEISLGENGKWIQISTYLNYDDLPEMAQTYLIENHREADFSNIIKLQTRRDIHYLVNFETKSNIVNLTFDPKGKLADKQVENMDDNE